MITSGKCLKQIQDLEAATTVQRKIRKRISRNLSEGGKNNEGNVFGMRTVIGREFMAM